MTIQFLASSLAVCAIALGASFGVACDEDNDSPEEALETVEENIGEGAQTAQDELDDIGDDEENTPDPTETPDLDTGE